MEIKNENINWEQKMETKNENEKQEAGTFWFARLCIDV